MSKPLALIYYSSMRPGSQLPGRLQDLGYRVQSVASPALLPDACEKEMPLVLVAEMTPLADVCAAVAKLKANPATQHVPVLAYSKARDAAAQAQSRAAGVNLLAFDAGLAEQLPQLLDQILQVE